MKPVKDWSVNYKVFAVMAIIAIIGIILRWKYIKQEVLKSFRHFSHKTADTTKID
jgi:predicted negative regulator of RcsB-dependent stress response